MERKAQANKTGWGNAAPAAPTQIKTKRRTRLGEVQMAKRLKVAEVKETAEVEERQETMRHRELEETRCYDVHDVPDVEQQPDHDHDKPRATVAQYVAVVGHSVALNLDGLAQARVEKHPRAYQTDAQVHEVYIQATSGGGLLEGEEASEAPRPR